MGCPTDGALARYLELTDAPSHPTDVELHHHLVSCDSCQVRVAEIRTQLGDESATVSEGNRDAFTSIEVARSRALRSRGQWVLEAGDSIDHFAVIRPLGRGATSEVYLARDTKLARKVALKLLTRRKFRTPREMDRALDEARATAACNHPNIVTIYSVGTWRGQLYLALEHLEGDSLRERMDGGRVSVREVLRIGADVAAALEAAHEHGILHRDLKPANVVIAGDGRVRVVDFGLALLSSRSQLADEEVDVQRRAGVQAGTPAYMSPEQWSGSGVTAASDAWALAVMLYEMLCGTRPFRAPNLLELEKLVCDRSLQAAPFEVEGLDEAVIDAILAGLSKQRGERASIARLREALDLALTELLAPRRVAHSPYRGLETFTEQHAETFFGRDAELGAFMERLRNNSVVPLVGPSGVGKSSFIHAGVIPRLREGASYRVLHMRPGPQPFVALERCLTRGGLKGVVADELADEPKRLGGLLRELARIERRNVLLFVDQLEEALTLQTEDGSGFVAALCQAADEAAEPVRVVLTLRGDFLGRLAQNVHAAQALRAVSVLHKPNAEALLETLTTPLRAVGYSFDDPALPKKMVEEVVDEVACLPLLQFAAQSLWERRDQDGRLLLASAYEEIGGVAGALARHADGQLDALSPDALALTRRLMLCLVTPEATRKSTTRNQLIDQLGPGAEEVLQRLIDARLVVIERTRDETARVELAHESLVTQWRTLSRWLEAGRAEVVFLQEALQAAELWDRRGRRPAELWKGGALTEAKRMRDHATDVPTVVTEFIDAGAALEGRERRRRRTVVATVIAALGLVSVVLALQNREAVHQGQLAKQHAQSAESKRAEALIEGALAARAQGNHLEARAKLRTSVELADSHAARALWWRLSGSSVHWVRQLGASGMYDVSFSPDGKELAAGSMDGSVYLLDTATSAVRVLRGHADQVQSAVYTPDGMRLASSSTVGTILIWNTQTGALEQTLKGHKQEVIRLLFDSHGQRLATVGFDGMRMWRLGQQKPLWHNNSFGTRVIGLAWSRDDKLLATADQKGGVVLWNPADGKQVRRLKGHRRAAIEVVFSADGRHLISGSADKTAIVWAVSSGKPIHTLTGHESAVMSVEASHDGRWIATGSRDRAVRLWNGKTFRLTHTLRGHTAEIRGMSFSPDGRWLASTSLDGSVRLWDTSVKPRRAPKAGHLQSVMTAVFHPNDTRLLSGGKDHELREWDAASGRVLRTIGGHEGVNVLAYSPDGSWFASGANDHTVTLWDARTGKAKQVLRAHERAVWALRFHPSGKQLASTGFDGTVRLWDIARGELADTLVSDGGVGSLFYHPTKPQLAAGKSDGRIIIWDLQNNQPEQIGRHPVGLAAVRVSDKQIVSAGTDKTVRQWSPAGDSQVIATFPSRLYAMDVSPDGNTVGVTGEFGAALLSIDGKTIRQLRGHDGGVVFADFDSTGARFATAGLDGTVRVWNVASAKASWHAPALLPHPPRLLTQRGWQQLDGSKNVAVPKRLSAALSKSARFASAAASRVCLLGHDGSVSLWDGDEQVNEWKGSAEQVVATQGCLIRTASQIIELPLTGNAKQLPFEGKPSALAASKDRVAVAAGRTVFLLKKGSTSRRELSVGIVALGFRGADLVVGYKEGNFEVLPDAGASAATIRPAAFQGVPSATPRSILAGPLGTIIVGYANGFVGLWHSATGARLADARLHGQVVHLLLENEKLHAATDLGSHLSWDLAPFYADECRFLQQLQREIPVVWNHGRLAKVTAPQGRRCRPRD